MANAFIYAGLIVMLAGAVFGLFCCRQRLSAERLALYR